MEPMKARFEAMVLESNFFQSTPGISSRSNFSVLTHCLPLVTPGRSAALARAEPANVLIKVDLPTLGMPQSITWVLAPPMPRFWRRASRPESSFSMAVCTAFAPPFCLALMATQPASAAWKYLIHSSVTAGSARSALFSAYSFGLRAVIRSISGLRLDSGMRASSRTRLASTCWISCSIMRRVLVIWPGNHWIFNWFANRGS